LKVDVEINTDLQFEMNYVFIVYLAPRLVCFYTKFKTVIIYYEIA